MCGIAGVIDLTGKREIAPDVLTRMADAMYHRGPDEDGFFCVPGVGFAQRRLSIVGLSDGQQPIFNEDRTVAVVFNGELFDHPEQRAALEAKGHVFRTHTDTEIIVHLYEEHGEDVFEKLYGQFAIALYDFRKRTVLLARDRTGICPLHWSRQGEHVVFGSEAKTLLASGLVRGEIDPRGLGHVFTFFGLATRRTMFAGIEAVLPGHYLRIAFRPDGRPAEIVERRYWDFDFPDAGEEENPDDFTPLVDEFEVTFRNAVDLRLRADVPVVGYLSGGVDSAYVLATAAKIRGAPPPSFTIKVPTKKLDETDHAMVSARHIGSTPNVVTTGSDVIAAAYPRLIRAADSPVIDTSCAALLALSGEVHKQGFKVALTGEGADEAFAGYVWFKIAAMQRWADVGTFEPHGFGSRLFRKLSTPHVKWSQLSRIDHMTGGPSAQAEFYNFVAGTRQKYFSDEMLERLDGHTAYEDVPLDSARMRRWHPLNRSLYLGYKVHLPGLLLNHKGDRVAMANSVETRYPFLDDKVIAFASRIHPNLKLRGFKQDKFLLRHAAARLLPKESAFRPKGMFRAPLAETFFVEPPAYVEQLMSRESLAKSGYFHVDAVRADYERYKSGKVSPLKVFSSMGLAGVLSTQLWHHQNFGGGLCDLPHGLSNEVLRAGRPTALAAE